MDEFELSVNLLKEMLPSRSINNESSLNKIEKVAESFKKSNKGNEIEAQYFELNSSAFSQLKELINSEAINEALSEDLQGIINNLIIRSERPTVPNPPDQPPPKPRIVISIEDFEELIKLFKK